MQDIARFTMKVLGRILLVPVYFYKYALSPLIPASCRHVPTCSQYAIEAIKTHGPFKGLWLATRRISHCHPWGTHGYDPVPPAGKSRVKNRKLKKIQTPETKITIRGLHENWNKHMKNVILFLIMTALGCNTKPSADEMIISVSILPQKYFVEKIAGDLVKVHVLVPPGASPELYSLMPSQMKELSRAAAWLRIGKIGFEESWLDKIRQSTPGLKIFDTSVQANWISGKEEKHGEHVHLHGIDPHIWSSPGEVKKIVTETYKALNSLLPGKKEVLSRNYETFMKEIDRLDQDLKSRFDQLDNRKFLIFHPALTYLARQYRLEQIALEVDGKEPSPKDMRSLIDKANSENIRMIFIQKEFDAENARQLAGEIDAEVIQIDPLNEQWDKQLREIAQKIVAADE